jgi:alkylation response protein AidB-like acyl-CoA dehydrogenase
MYVDLTPEQKALRQEIRAYFSQLMNDESREQLRREDSGRQAEYKRLCRQMGKDGWLAVGWPKEYGGRGYSPIEQLIFFEEVFLSGATLPFVTVNTVGPALLAHGSDEHKKKFLPGMAAGETHFAIGYTEANAGTDLATLNTTAVFDGEHFIVNGTKQFTTDAESADYIWLACRTNPEEKRHKGISIIIVDTKLPGYSLTPIHTVGHRTNTTYFDNVKVPANMLVGALNGGWKLITAQLNHERVGLGAFGVKATACFRDVLAWAKTADAQGHRAVDEPWVRRALAESYSQIEAMRLLNYRIASDISAGRMDIGLASASKVYGSETMVAVFRRLLEVVGMGGLYRLGSKAAELHALLEEEYRAATINTFGGGVNELQRDLIAQFGLRMPRSR